MEMFYDAGPVVKAVILVLIYMSVVCWAIIALKWRVVRRAMRESDEFLDFFWAKKRFDSIAQGVADFPRAPLAILFREAYQELIRGQRRREGEGEEQPLDFGGGGNLARALRRATTSEVQRLEKFLPFLATTGSAAPFIGLFGTVWGIMDAFHGIGQSGSASLAVVAPGISEALLATAIGLAAAIPAVIGYNHFIAKVTVLSNEMDNFSQEMLNIVERMGRR